MTGGNKGIGLETTKIFLAMGYEVMIIARDFNNYEFSSHQNVKCYPYDLTDIDNIPTLLTNIGPIDILINNAEVMYSLPYDNYSQENVAAMLKLANIVTRNNATIPYSFVVIAHFYSRIAFRFISQK